MAHPLLLAVLPKILDNVIKSVLKPKDGVNPDKTGTKTAIAAAPVVAATAAVGTGQVTTGDPTADMIMTVLGAVVSYILVVYRDHQDK